MDPAVDLNVEDCVVTVSGIVAGKIESVTCVQILYVPACV